MFDPFDQEDHDLDAEIARLHSSMKKMDATEEAYQKTSQQLSHLYRLRYERAELILKAKNQYAEIQHKSAEHQLEEDKLLLERDKNCWQEEQDQRSWWQRVEPSTYVTVGGNLLVALIVVKYEQTGVISTQVRNFMRKI